MAIVRVQAPAVASATITGTTITNTFGANVTAGNLLVAMAVGQTGATQTYSSTGAPTWTKIAQFTETGGSGQDFSLAYCLNCPGGATTVTLTYSVTKQFRGLIIAEYSGAAIAAALDKNTTGLTTGLTATPTDTSMTTTANGELIVSICIFRNATRPASAGAGFTAIGIDNTNSNFGGEDQIQASAGAIAPSFTLTAGTAASGIMSATFMAAAATPNPPPPRRRISYRRRHSGLWAPPDAETILLAA
jgi:hypothetical protein